MDIPDIIPALATWIAGTHPTKIAAVQISSGADSGFVKDAVQLAGAEPIYVTMHGLAGIDLASAAASPMAVTFRKKVIVVFDYDAIASNDPSTMLAVAAAMKINKVPCVIVGNSFRGKTDLPKHHAVFEVAGGPVAVRRDKGIAGAEAALSGEIREYSGDGIAAGAVFDNYLSVNPEFADVCHIAEAFSAADVIGEQLCRAGDFDDPYSFVPIAAAALWSGNSKKVTITTFGTVWSKTNAMYAKVNSVRVISKAFEVSGSRLLWTPTTGVDLVRGMMASSADHVGVAKRLALPPPALLAIMRLWKTKYTLATHAKVKKSLGF
jgi:hypothetical protein